MPVIVGLARGGATVLDGAHAQGVLRLCRTPPPPGRGRLTSASPRRAATTLRGPGSAHVSAIELMTRPPANASDRGCGGRHERGERGAGKRVRCALAGPDGAPLKKLKADGTKEESTDSENEARRSNAGGEMTITYSAASALRARAREREETGRENPNVNFDVTFPLFRVGGGGRAAGRWRGTVADAQVQSRCRTPFTSLQRRWPRWRAIVR